MDFHVTPNGNLTLTMDPGEREDLQDLLDRTSHRDHGFLADLMEHAGWTGNGRLWQVYPEHIPGALTDAPIISDEVVIEDDGRVNVVGRVWWFPGYEMRSFAEELLEKGAVTFTLAPADNEQERAGASRPVERPVAG